MASSSTHRALVVVFAAVACGAAMCPEPEPDAGPLPCEPTFVGDEGSEPEMEIVHRSADGEVIDAVPDGPVELFRPPQGGKVFLTAARVRNVDSCGLRINASISDECTGRVIGLEQRPFATRVDDEGWVVPLSATSLSSWANVPACPSQAAVRRVDGEPYLLTVRIEDRGGRRVEQSMRVVPRCVQTGFLGEQCRCECSPEYTLGDRCESVDGGAGDAGAGDVPADGGVSERDGGVVDAGAVELVCPDEEG